MQDIDSKHIPSDILTEWMNVIDTTSDKSSPRGNPHRSPSMASVHSDGSGDDWVLPDKLSLSRHSSYGTVSSYGVVLEADSIMNMLGIQRASSTSSLGIAESWETKADKRTPSSGSRTPINGIGGSNQAQTAALTAAAKSLELSIRIENVPPTSSQTNRQNKISDFLSWCLPSKSGSGGTTGPNADGATLCPAVSPSSASSKPSPSPTIRAFSSRNGKISLATIQELTWNECYDIDEEDDDDEEEEEEEEDQFDSVFDGDEDDGGCCDGEVPPMHRHLSNLSDTL